MRKSKYSAAEAAELDETKAREVRKGGLGYVSIRDRGWARLNTGQIVRWHSIMPTWSTSYVGKTQIKVKNDNVPDGQFVIKTKHEEIILDAEELMRFLRWA